VAEHDRRAVFKLRKVTFKGEGMAGDFVGRPWEAVRDAIYDGRGS
jgi:hypothetical protein